VSAILQTVATYREPIYINRHFKIDVVHVDDPTLNKVRILLDLYAFVPQSTGRIQ